MNNEPPVIRFEKWYQAWRNIFANEAQARAMFDEASTVKESLIVATTDAYNAINAAMQTLLVCDHVSMLRHPQIVDGLHQALNGLKRALHQNAEASHGDIKP